MSNQILFLPCAAGVEAWLADEVQRIIERGVGADQARVHGQRGGVAVEVSFDAALDLTMQLNLESRLAQRVLWEMAYGPYRDEHDLYDLARQARWSDWVTPRETLRVDVTSQRSPLKSLNFAALRVKDAVCDAMRDDFGERPSVDTHRPDLPLVLHLAPEYATLYADTSGEALFKRGWREDKGEAPLKETLAAAMLAAAGWHGRPEDGALLDPCCGAGTIAIEAAQVACDIAPGLQRRFAFERWLPFRDERSTWYALKDAARARVRAAEVPIYAGDVAFRLTDFATRNAERAGVLRAIDLKTADALQRMPPCEHGTLMLNPPYGERIGPKGTQSSRDEAPQDFFQRLSAHWKRHYAGWTAWVLSPDLKLPTAMRLKESRRIPMWNGPIECRFFRFDLVSGSMRSDAAEAPEPEQG
ncbi:class I SAM-dependent RNA methyltransferase [Aquabacterium sp.]|uniref:THUMP domain-containing class I SAM-dependent RNA methyltransferase n=1 Tax=Aquabacterium sp. TaxID=1872578 RepID=UPI0035AFDA30